MIRTVGLLAVLALLGVLVATVPPVQFSYVTSDSMAPTMAVDDGFLVWTGGQADPGEIVTFGAERRDRPVTHRVVERTPSGLVTQGDDNPTTDQAAGYSHVRREEVVGTVVTVDGDPLVVPGVGAVVRAASGNRGLLVGLLALLALVGLLGRESAERDRDLRRAGDVLVVVVVVAPLALVGATLWGGQTATFQYVAVESEGTTAPTTMTVGESRADTVVVNRSRGTFTRAVVDTSGMTVQNRTANASTVRLTVRVPAQAEPGPHAASVRLHRYPAVVPHATLRRLDAVHPVVAAVATVGLVTVPLALAALLVVDPRSPVRSRSRPRSRDGGGR